jgi:predicted lipoprotein with Yx(FWY)xxD motif
MIVDVEGNTILNPNSNTRTISYEIAVSCDDCLGGSAYEGSFTSNTTDLLVFGFDDGSEACAEVRAVSGNTNDVSEWTETSCATASCVADCVAGDVTGDGQVNVLDIVATVNYILEGGDDFAVDCGDVTGDGLVNVLDIVASVNLILEGRVADATKASLIKEGNALNLNADGYIGAVQMTLTHDSDFSIELTENAMVADYRTNGNETTLIVVAPTGKKIFTAEGDYTINDVIVANSATEIDAVLAPTSFSLSEAYPNPFNPTTSINLSIPESGFVSVQVYNVIGQLVGTLANGYMDASDYSFTWNASSAPSGLYLITASTANHTSTQKVMLLK